MKKMKGRPLKSPLYPVLLSLLLLQSLLSAGQMRLDHLETTLLSKKGQEPVDVTLSLVLEGRDVTPDNFKLMDVIQTALGNFWAETLVTAQGKRELKKTIVQLADKQYGIEVDFVYLLDLKVRTDSLQKCLELFERASSTLRR